MKLILLVIAVLAMASVVKAVPAASQDLEQADFDKLSDFTEDDVDATPIELTKDNADATLDELTEDDVDVDDETTLDKKKKKKCPNNCGKGKWLNRWMDQQTGKDHCTCDACPRDRHRGVDPIYGTNEKGQQMTDCYKCDDGLKYTTYRCVLYPDRR